MKTIRPTRRRKPQARLSIAIGLLAALVGAASAVAKSPSPPLIAGKPVCPTVALHFVHCGARVLTNGAGQAVGAALPSGYGPVQFQTAYGLLAAAAQSTNEVVAIVDAYDDPTVKADLDTYTTAFGLPAFPTCSGPSNVGCFRKVNQTGGSTPPAVDQSWALEISLDVQTVHAVCPNCGILLVEASSNFNSDLFTAEDYATAHATVVSNSWGGGEYFGESSDDVHFNHPGEAITFSTGDNGFGVQYPAASQYVTAVGGTTLTLNADNTRKTETVWNGAGSGCSFRDPKPSWEKDSGCVRRMVADVSADADPNTGAAVFDSTPYQGSTGWWVVGGTSLASPLIAATYALAGVGGTSDYPASYPYSHTANLFDVVSGSNGSCSPSYFCTAGVGYDGPSGLGTPIGTAAFSPSGSPPPPAPTVTSFSPTSGPAGTQVDVQGTNFTGATSVKFNGTSDTSFVVNSSTDITAHVPASATTGPISVTTPNGTGTSSTSFTVTTGGGGNPPSISSFAPTSGPVGTNVSITGGNFTGATTVTFNGTSASTFTVNSDTSISATVPTGATTGPISVSTSNGTGTSAGNFTVTTTSGKPTITGFTPTSGYPGTKVTITGTNFTGASTVKLGTVAAAFTVKSSTQIVATVPVERFLGSYRWSVTTPGGTATSTAFFRYL